MAETRAEVAMKRVVVSTSSCLACKGCELACAVEHSQSKNIYEAIAEEPLPAPRVDVEALDGAAVPLQCRHCEDAPCVEVCPSGALTKSETGAVLLDAERCIGCKWCILVCPFGLVWLADDGLTLLKCDLCEPRTSQGKRPACVEACPTGALRYVELEEVVRGKRGRFASRLHSSEELGEVSSHGGVESE